MMEKVPRKEIVLSEVARFLDKSRQEGINGAEFYELLYHLKGRKTILGFEKKENIVPGHLLESLILGDDAKFTIDEQLVVRFKEEEPEPRPRRRRNRKQSGT